MVFFIYKKKCAMSMAGIFVQRAEAATLYASGKLQASLHSSVRGQFSGRSRARFIMPESRRLYPAAPANAGLMGYRKV